MILTPGSWTAVIRVAYPLGVSWDTVNAALAYLYTQAVQTYPYAFPTLGVVATFQGYQATREGEDLIIRVNLQVRDVPGADYEQAYKDLSELIFRIVHLSGLSLRSWELVPQQTPSPSPAPLPSPSPQMPWWVPYAVAAGLGLVGVSLLAYVLTS